MNVRAVKVLLANELADPSLDPFVRVQVMIFDGLMRKMLLKLKVVPEELVRSP